MFSMLSNFALSRMWPAILSVYLISLGLFRLTVIVHEYLGQLENGMMLEFFLYLVIIGFSVVPLMRTRNVQRRHEEQPVRGAFANFAYGFISSIM